MAQLKKNKPQYMKIAPLPLNESERLKTLKSYSIMDSFPEKEFESITQLAVSICGTPTAFISLGDGDQQCFKSIVGIGVSETIREFCFCQYGIMDNEVYEVSNPLVTGGSNIRFYAGAPLQDSNGFNLGSLCFLIP